MLIALEAHANIGISETGGVTSPFLGQLVIKSKGTASIQHFEVYDLSGRILLDQELDNHTSMTKLDLIVPSGIYFMKITSSENEVLTKKILIQK